MKETIIIKKVVYKCDVCDCEITEDKAKFKCEICGRMMCDYDTFSAKTADGEYLRYCRLCEILVSAYCVDIKSWVGYYNRMKDVKIREVKAAWRKAVNKQRTKENTGEFGRSNDTR